MSTFVHRTVPCPHCGVRAERLVATSVNAGRSPEYREQILAGTFQRQDCHGCGRPVDALGRFVYIDFDGGQFIAVHPSADEDRWPALEDEALGVHRRNMGADAPPVAQGFGHEMRVRVVFGLDSLRETLLMLDNAIDEVAVEAAKLALWLGHRSPHRPLRTATRPRLEAVAGQDLRFRVTDGETVTMSRDGLEQWAAEDETARRLRRVFAGRPYRGMLRLADA